MQMTFRRNGRIPSGEEAIERKLLKKDIAPSNVFNIISQNVTILSEFVNL